MTIETVTLGGMKTVRLTRDQLAAQMVADCLAQRESARTLPPKLVFSSNGQGIAMYNTAPAFASAMDQADYIHADGMPVVMASRVMTPSRALPERIATTDFFHDAAKAAIKAGLSFYFLGGTEQECNTAIEAAQKMYPALKIVGGHHGYADEKELSEIFADIRAAQADVVWLALGKPKQEYFALRHKGGLNGVGWVKTCGGLYKFLSGEDERAPLWMQKMGLEWFFRFKKEPRRLFRRYLVTNALCAWFLLVRSR